MSASTSEKASPKVAKVTEAPPDYFSSNPGEFHPQLPLELIRFREQPRYNFSEAATKDLGESLKERGQQQSITVYREKTKKGEPFFLLKSGQRRVMAARGIGWENLMAVEVKRQIPKDRWLDQMVENFQRENFSPLEEIHAIAGAIARKIPLEPIAKAIGKTVSTLEKGLPILNLPEPIQKEFDEKTLPKETAIELAGLPPDRVAEAHAASKKAATVERKSANIKAYMASLTAGPDAEYEGLTEEQIKAKKAAKSVFAKHKKFNRNGNAELLVEANSRNLGALKGDVNIVREFVKAMDAAVIAAEAKESVKK